MKMNKGLQIFSLKKKLEKDGFEGMDKIDFECHVDSMLTFEENLDNILHIIDELKLDRKQ